MTSDLVNLEVSFVTFHDDRLPGSCLTNKDDAAGFALTTGGFPHELICTTRASSANLSKIRLLLHDAKDVEVLVQMRGAVDALPIGGDFTSVMKSTLARGTSAAEGGRPAGTQVALVELDPTTTGKSISAVQIIISSGYSEFVGVLHVDAWGEESMQRVAVLESKPDFNM